MMRPILSQLVAAVIVIALGGCGGGDEGSIPSASPPPESGVHKALGQRAVPGYVVAIELEGPVQPGSDLSVLLTVTPDSAGIEPPVAVGGWVASQTVADPAAVAATPLTDPVGGWRLILGLPDPLPAGSGIWVRIEDPTGNVMMTGREDFLLEQ